MTALLSLLFVLFCILPTASAFSNVPSRSVSCFRVSNPPRLSSSFPTSSLKTPSRLLADANDDNDETPVETSDAITNSTTVTTYTISNEEIAVDDVDDTAIDETTTDEKGVFGKLKARLGGGKKFDKASLAKLGGSVLLSYGFVSNIFGITCVSCAWYIASKKTGLSPLAPGQWKGFLTVYAAFFAFLNVIRPARLALSVYISKYFDRVLNAIQNRFNCNKGKAVGILVTVQVLFNFSFMFLGIATASALAGVPFWTGRV